MTTYYHNPKCSKSRQGLEILTQKGLKFTIKEYLKEPMTYDELKALFSKLGKAPQEVVRTKEDLYKELKLQDQNLREEQWIDIIIENPKLLERPILVTEEKAVIGRPPEELNTIC